MPFRKSKFQNALIYSYIGINIRRVLFFENIIIKYGIVLNSRDWSEIIWLPKNSHFKINLPIGLYPKKPTGMHWLGRNDAVP